MGMLAFCILGSYALARPAVESIFLSVYGAAHLPLGWLAVTGGAIGVVAGYERCAARLGLARLLLGAIGLSAGVLVLLLGVGRPAGAMLLFVWKDLYVVVLIETFWSLANVLSDGAQARRSYGWYCALGSLGGVVGNLVGGSLAGRLGSHVVVLLVIPVLAVAGGCALLLGRRPEVRQARPQRPQRARTGDALRVVGTSRYLLPLLGVVALVQVVLAVVDLQCTAALERAYPALDARTAVLGRIYAAIDASSIALQVLTGPLLRLLGVGGVLLGVPSLLGGCLGLVLAAPGVATLVLAKVVGKAMDYSLFRAAKEMLYLPLSYEEKTQGKALIDMLVYRLAKGGASLLLLGAGTRATSAMLTLLGLAAVGGWVGLILIILPRYRQAA